MKIKKNFQDRTTSLSFGILIYPGGFILWQLILILEVTPAPEETPPQCDSEVTPKLFYSDRVWDRGTFNIIVCWKKKNTSTLSWIIPFLLRRTKIFHKKGNHYYVTNLWSLKNNVFALKIAKGFWRFAPFFFEDFSL